MSRERDKILITVEEPLVPASLVLELMRISLDFACRITGIQLNVNYNVEKE